MELRLSDSFERKEESPDLELKVLVLNINEGMNQEIIEACQTLKEYCIYVGRVRRYTETMVIEEAVERAVLECIEDGILVDFLKKQRAEVISMSIFEYNEEEEIKKIRESERRSARIEAFAEGEANGEIKGRAETLLEILEYRGNISEDIKTRILEQKNLSTLQEWIKIAMVAETIEEFAKRIF